LPSGLQESAKPTLDPVIIDGSFVGDRWLMDPAFLLGYKPPDEWVISDAHVPSQMQLNL